MRNAAVALLCLALALPVRAGAQGVSVLTEVERALRESRELSARFDEAAALARLLLAERLLLEALEIPHVHAWLAEVELEIGVCAAQLGQLDLSDSAFGRASALHANRRLQAAEAPPWILERARAAERKAAAAALTQTRVEVTPTGAHVRLDGRELGNAPLELLVPSGSHVLQVDNPGYRPYASLLELGPGRRLPVQIQLAPTPVEEARRRLSMTAPLEPPAQITGETPAREVVSGPASKAPPPSETRAWWKKWPFWTAAVVAVGAGTAAAVLATRKGTPQETRELHLDPGQLPR